MCFSLDECFVLLVHYSFLMRRLFTPLEGANADPMPAGQTSTLDTLHTKYAQCLDLNNVTKKVVPYSMFTKIVHAAFVSL